MARILPALVLAIASATSGAALAADWDAVADVGNITVLTENEDGSERETTIWFLVLDGEAHIRTGNTTWGGNLERNPDVTLVIEGERYPVRATRVTDAATLERANAAFRTKYGFSDYFSAMARWLGGGGRIYRVAPR